MERIRRGIVRLAVGALIAVVVVGGARDAADVVFRRGVRCLGHRTFDAAEWQSAGGPGDRGVRGCMVEDYLRRYPPAARSRDAVLRDLGQPPPPSYFREYDLVYWLGPEPGWIAMDSEWLVFRFDPTGRVAEAKLVTD